MQTPSTSPLLAPSAPPTPPSLRLGAWRVLLEQSTCQVILSIRATNNLTRPLHPALWICSAAPAWPCSESCWHFRHAPPRSRNSIARRTLPTRIASSSKRPPIRPVGTNGPNSKRSCWQTNCPTPRVRQACDPAHRPGPPTPLSLRTWYELQRLKPSGRGCETLRPVAIYLADVAERARQIIQVLCRRLRQVGAVRDGARPS